MKYKYADFIVQVSPHEYNYLIEISADYIIDKEEVDVFLKVDQKDVLKELELSETKYEKPNGLLHSTAVQRKFAEWLPLHEAFILHSATFDVDGVGVAFSAHSGTGKTTHMRLWQQLLGDKMVVVNGDKPIVRFFDDEPEVPYAYGTPWNGKEHLGCNMRTPLKHICFIERSETNFVEKLDKKDVVSRILSQVYMPKDPIAVINTLQLIDRLLSCCSLWKIHCNMELEAAEIAYKTIFNKKENV